MKVRFSPVLFSIIVLILLVGVVVVVFAVRQVEENTDIVVVDNTTVAYNVNGVANINAEVSTNTNDLIDTSDWLTYENQKNGFSFRYPEHLAVTEGTSGLFDGKVITRVLAVPSATGGDAFIEIYIVDDLLENVKEYLNGREFEYYDKAAEWQLVKIGEQQVEHAQKAYNFAGDFFKNIYVFEKNNLVYVVYTFTNVGESDSVISTFEIK